MPIIISSSFRSVRMDFFPKFRIFYRSSKKYPKTNISHWNFVCESFLLNLTIVKIKIKNIEVRPVKSSQVDVVMVDIASCSFHLSEESFTFVTCQNYHTKCSKICVNQPYRWVESSKMQVTLFFFSFICIISDNKCDL